MTTRKKSRSGSYVPESGRSSLRIQFRLSLRERQYLEAKAQTAGLTPTAYAQRLVVRSLAIPGTEEPRDPDCDADERYERAREYDEYLDTRDD